MVPLQRVVFSRKAGEWLVVVDLHLHLKLFTVNFGTNKNKKKLLN